VDEELIELLTLTPAIFKRANRILEQCHRQVPLRSPDALHQASPTKMSQSQRIEARLNYVAYETQFYKFTFLQFM